MYRASNRTFHLVRQANSSSQGRSRAPGRSHRVYPAGRHAPASNLSSSRPTGPGARTGAAITLHERSQFAPNAFAHDSANSPLSGKSQSSAVVVTVKFSLSCGSRFRAKKPAQYRLTKCRSKALHQCPSDTAAIASTAIAQPGCNVLAATTLPAGLCPVRARAQTAVTRSTCFASAT